VTHHGATVANDRIGESTGSGSAECWHLGTNGSGASGWRLAGQDRVGQARRGSSESYGSGRAGD
jgi:hypothetical protein